ncbi:elongation factor Ts [Alphaproteobacteria bacterium]|nr:elongation factor Ts [Alphaproteobacteria bacterium]GHS98871.1 elongation factor Ts [Alphaproteobacteria bacterium]
MSVPITTELIRKIREKTGAGMMDCKTALVEVDGNFDEAVDWLRKKGLAAAAKKASRVAADGLVCVAAKDDRSAVVLEVNSETDFVAKNQKFQDFVLSVAKMAAESSLTDRDALLSASLNGTPLNDAATDLIAVLGENIDVRRVASVTVSEGIVAAYVHSAVAPGLGKIGVLVALESSGTSEILKEFGHKLAMHAAASSPFYLTIADVPTSVIDHEKEILREQIAGSDRPPEVLEKMLEGRVRKFFEETVFVEQPYVMDNKKKVAAAVQEFAKELGAPVALKAFVRFALGEGIEKTVSDFAEDVKVLMA